MEDFVARGLLLAWWMLIPGVGMAAMWALAIFADREKHAAARVSTNANRNTNLTT